MILHPIIDRLKIIAELLPTAIGGEFVPTGTKQISITENGTTTENVFSYADAEITVNVPPSGASLPIVIDGIDGGSFTVPSDTSASDYSINHNLGTIPNGFVIWTEDPLSGTISTRYMANAFMSTGDVTRSDNTNYVALGAVSILYNGNASISNVTVTTSTISGYMTTNSITWNNALIFFKSGLTYNWIAWS